MASKGKNNPLGFTNSDSENSDGDSSDGKQPAKHQMIKEDQKKAKQSKEDKKKEKKPKNLPMDSHQPRAGNINNLKNNSSSDEEDYVKNLPNPKPTQNKKSNAPQIKQTSSSSDNSDYALEGNFNSSQAKDPKRYDSDSSSDDNDKEDNKEENKAMSEGSYKQTSSDDSDENDPPVQPAPAKKPTPASSKPKQLVPGHMQNNLKDRADDIKKLGSSEKDQKKSKKSEESKQEQQKEVSQSTPKKQKADPQSVAESSKAEPKHSDEAKQVKKPSEKKSKDAKPHKRANSDSSSSDEAPSGLTPPNQNKKLSKAYKEDSESSESEKSPKHKEPPQEKTQPKVISKSNPKVLSDDTSSSDDQDNRPRGDVPPPRNEPLSDGSSSDDDPQSLQKPVVEDQPPVKSPPQVKQKETVEDEKKVEEEAPHVNLNNIENDGDKPSAIKDANSDSESDNAPPQPQPPNEHKGKHEIDSESEEFESQGDHEQVQDNVFGDESSEGSEVGKQPKKLQKKKQPSDHSSNDNKDHKQPEHHQQEVISDHEQEQEPDVHRNEHKKSKKSSKAKKQKEPQVDYDPEQVEQPDEMNKSNMKSKESKHKKSKKDSSKKSNKQPKEDGSQGHQEKEEQSKHAKSSSKKAKKNKVEEKEVKLDLEDPSHSEPEMPRELEEHKAEVENRMTDEVPAQVDIPVKQVDQKPIKEKKDRVKPKKYLKSTFKEGAGKVLKKTHGFIYKIDAEGYEVLVDAKEKTPYEYKKEDYDQMVNSIQDYIQMRMVQQFNLKTKLVPFKDDLTVDGDYCRAPIFVSPDWSRNTKRALVLIQGMGSVRAGTWSRRVCTEHSLEIGSMLPQIKFAIENDMSVLVMNPNYDLDDFGKQIDPLINTKEKHCNYVFKKYVVNRCIADEIFIIAHSYGGKCCSNLISRFFSEFEQRVTAVAFTDPSKCKIETIDVEEEEWVKNHCISYIASNKKVGKKIKNSGQIEQRSAGHEKHEYTTGASWLKIQEFFQKKSKDELQLVETECFSEYAYVD